MISLSLLTVLSWVMGLHGDGILPMPNLLTLSTRVATLPQGAKAADGGPFSYGWISPDQLWYVCRQDNDRPAIETLNTKTHQVVRHDRFSRHLNAFLSQLNPGVEIRDVRVALGGNSVAFLVGDFVGPPEALVVATLDGRRWRLNPHLGGVPPAPISPLPIPYTWLGDGRTLTALGDNLVPAKGNARRAQAMTLLDLFRPAVLKVLPVNGRGTGWSLWDTFAPVTRSRKSVYLLFWNADQQIADCVRFRIRDGREIPVQRYRLPAALDEAVVRSDGQWIAWVVAPSGSSHALARTREVWLSRTSSSRYHLIGTLPMDPRNRQPIALRWMPEGSGLSFVQEGVVYVLSLKRFLGTHGVRRR